MFETDEQLYSRFLEKEDSRDLAELLDRHRESLTLFLYGYVHDMEDAEELMMDAFAVVAAGKNRFFGHSSFRTWLFAIGRNRALSMLRRKRLSFESIDIRDGSAEASPETPLFREERRRNLYRALSSLKEEYRQVLYLLYFEDMSHEEAGRVMGKSRKQIYNLAERGRKALKETLKRMGFDDADY